MGEMHSETIDKIFNKLDGLKADIGGINVEVGIIKSVLKGNGSEGFCQKVERHDRILWMAAGSFAIISFVVTLFSVFRR